MNGSLKSLRHVRDNIRRRRRSSTGSEQHRFSSGTQLYSGIASYKQWYGTSEVCVVMFGMDVKNEQNYHKIHL